jgi:hypothetical protein
MFDQARHKFRVSQKAGLNDTDDQTIKGWGYISAAGALSDGFNVLSVADGSGTTTVTWDRKFQNANYAVAACAINSGAFFVKTSAYSASAVTFDTTSDAAVVTDNVIFTFIAIGDQ